MTSTEAAQVYENPLVDPQDAPAHADTLPDRRDSGHTHSGASKRVAATGGFAIPGRLDYAAPDAMTLHTREAYYLFNGDHPGRRDASMLEASGRNFASAMKSIWQISGRDNPFADWLLIRLYDGLVAQRARIAERTAAREAVIEQSRRKGLVFAVLESSNPRILELGFRSPYGYAAAEAIVEFDYYVRLNQTLVHKDRLRRADGQGEIRGLNQSLRDLFLKALRWEHLLRRQETIAIRRIDFAPEAGDAARRRIAAATTAFGNLPPAVLKGIETPRHVKQREVYVGSTQKFMAPIAVDTADTRRVASDKADASPLPAQPSEIANGVSRETSNIALQVNQQFNQR